MPYQLYGLIYDIIRGLKQNVLIELCATRWQKEFQLTFQCSNKNHNYICIRIQFCCMSYTIIHFFTSVERKEIILYVNKPECDYSYTVPTMLLLHLGLLGIWT